MNDWNREHPEPAGMEPVTPRDDRLLPPSEGSIPPFGDSAAPGGAQAQKTRQKLPKRLMALCLIVALVGGTGGGALTAAILDRSGGRTVLYEGERPQVILEQVSTARDRALTMPEIYANYVNACVGISVDIVTTNFFGQQVKGAAAGSGFVVSEDGYIVTNYHVVENANAITVSFIDGTSYPARYVGGDSKSDAAVLKIEATGLTPVILGDSSLMYVGEPVATIGNPLGELTFSLSDGVVSALDRTITLSDDTRRNMLQTNCTINSGSSGGPLFNLYGEVIGIVSNKYFAVSSAYTTTATLEGLGFAIPINDVRDLIRDLIEKGYISGLPYLGVSVQTVSQAVQRYGVPAGAEIIYATPGLAAAKAGIQEGDIVTAVDDRLIDSNIAFIDANNGYRAGDTAVFTVYRQGETMQITVTYGEKTTEAEAAHSAYASERQAEAAQAEPAPGSGSGGSTIPYGAQGGSDFAWPFD